MRIGVTVEVSFDLNRSGFIVDEGTDSLMPDIGLPIDSQVGFILKNELTSGVVRTGAELGGGVDELSLLDFNIQRLTEKGNEIEEPSA